MQDIIFLKNTDPKNEIILFLFCRLTDPNFFSVFPVDQKNNLILPNWKIIQKVYMLQGHIFLEGKLAVSETVSKHFRKKYR